MWCCVFLLTGFVMQLFLVLSSVHFMQLLHWIMSLLWLCVNRKLRNLSINCENGGRGCSGTRGRALLSRAMDGFFVSRWRLWDKRRGSWICLLLRGLMDLMFSPLRSARRRRDCRVPYMSKGILLSISHILVYLTWKPLKPSYTVVWFHFEKKTVPHKMYWENLWMLFKLFWFYFGGGSWT